MNENLGDKVKRELLGLQIKSPCCKSSFKTGVTVFAKSRKNKFTDELDEYVGKLSRQKKKSFFGEDEGVGYLVAEESGHKYPSGGKTCQYCQSMLLRGAFLVCGRASVATNNKGMHVEMAVPDGKNAEILSEILASVGLEPKRSVRRGETLLYYKKRETIYDFLAYIGAVTLSFDLMNEEIMSERKAVAQRQTICDTTNIKRSLDAAGKQVAAIKAIKKRGAFDELPPTLKETAIIRLENPSESLDGITELHSGGLSRSAVNRRLHKIIEWAHKKGYITS